MDIYWGGQALFKLKGKQATVIIDPFDPEFTNLKLPKDMVSDVVLLTHSHNDHNNSKAVASPEGKSPMVFDLPGEYEVKGAVVTGINSFHDNSQGSERGKNIIFHLLFEGLNIVHLGDLGQSQLTEQQIAQISATDILLIPVGGVYTIDAKAAAGIISQLEPSIIIPMHYSIEGLKATLDPVDKFLKEMGAESVVARPKLSISKDKLPEEPQVILLAKSS